MDKDFWVRCVSFHNDCLSFSVELSDSNGNYYPGASALFDWIACQEGAIAHNAGFEMGATYAMTGKEMRIKACTYALLGALANEGSPGQSWGLKPAGMELGEVEDWSKDVPKSAEMGRLPFEQLGWYNQQDSAMTWHIYKLCREAVTEHWDTWGKHFWQYIEEDVNNQIYLQFEAYVWGLNMDVPYTEQYIHDIKEEIEVARKAFLDHPDVKPFIDKYNRMVYDGFDEQVANYNKKFKKDGSETVNFGKLQLKAEAAKQECHFNMNSTEQMRHLIYNQLGVEARHFTDTGEPSTKKAALKEIPIYGRLILDYRDKVAQFKFLRAALSNNDNGILRVPIKTPGCVTGRLSAGSIE